MKFAKELEQDLVPEWRIKYLDYKTGKKRVKAVSRATTRMNATPRPSADPNPDQVERFPSRYGTISPFAARQKASPLRPTQDQSDADAPTNSLRNSPAPFAADSRPTSYGSVRDFAITNKTPPMPILRRPTTPEESDSRYGSFVPTPPRRDRAGTFTLPDPAVDPDSPMLSVPDRAQGVNTPDGNDGASDSRLQNRRRLSDSTHNAYEVGRTDTPHSRATFSSLRNKTPKGEGKSPFLRRMFSVGTPLTHVQSRRIDTNLVVVDQVRMRQREFFAWMDRELEKVETFYKMKEDEAGERLAVLRDQLHEMRNRRIEEIAEMESAKYHRADEDNKSGDEERPTSRDKLTAWFDPVERVLEEAKAKTMAKINKPGANSKAFRDMASPGLRARNPDDGKDFVRRPHGDSVPYRTAKRKLKLALQEYYRSMELLKSYALLNRIAFRKINKKYDKAIDAHPPLRYMSEKVNKSWFVQSDVLDSHMHATEDLYARYFERGNRKVATGKLRSSSGKSRDQSASAFRNGMLIGIGAVFAVQGVIYSTELLNGDDPEMITRTSYLLQIYAGYFLGLYLFSWFCLDCAIWSRQKINYQFVFEYDPRHHLDWRELSEFPSFLVFLFGLFLWLNFTQYGVSEMYIYYPVILIAVTVAFIFLPARAFYYRSRKWFTYSLWRLFWAGLYPVEFRDFFLGDMFCSLTYLMSNISLFFCLYSTAWGQPSQCNSTHSRLMGFFSTIPSIWRALQCLRRYYDTRNKFPHLVNFGKYIMSVVYYVVLSIYRIDQTNRNLAVLITFAITNSIYSSIWDILMDWSLLQPNSKKRFLRDVRGIKNANYYYAAMILDPILRFNWIFYALYTHDLQHSTIASFFVAFSEATRRGIWVVFRVENEHCSNVARFKASRDVPLPYELPIEIHADEHEQEAHEIIEGSTYTQASPAMSRLRSHTATALEAQVSRDSTLRRRPGTFTSPSIGRTLTKIVADAHTQDFEKKRKPGTGKEEGKKAEGGVGKERELSLGTEGSESSSEEDDDEQTTRDVLDAHALLRERRGTVTQRDEGGGASGAASGGANGGGAGTGGG